METYTLRHAEFNYSILNGIGVLKSFQTLEIGDIVSCNDELCWNESSEYLTFLHKNHINHSNYSQTSQSFSPCKLKVNRHRFSPFCQQINADSHSCLEHRHHYYYQLFLQALKNRNYNPKLPLVINNYSIRRVLLRSKKFIQSNIQIFDNM